jgi:hypothetical protein
MGCASQARSQQEPFDQTNAQYNVRIPFYLAYILS